MEAIDSGTTQFINGRPVTGNYDDSIRFHVNISQCQDIQKLDGLTWSLVDFHTFGHHFHRLPTLSLHPTF